MSESEDEKIDGLKHENSEEEYNPNLVKREKKTKVVKVEGCERAKEKKSADLKKERKGRKKANKDYDLIKNIIDDQAEESSNEESENYSQSRNNEELKNFYRRKGDNFNNVSSERPIEEIADKYEKYADDYEQLDDDIDDICLYLPTLSDPKLYQVRCEVGLE